MTPAKTESISPKIVLVVSTSIQPYTARNIPLAEKQATKFHVMFE